MARGRMLDNCISISEKINDLSLKEAFIYTWIIPHLDDWGRMSGSPRTIKALVFPMKTEISIKDIESALGKFAEVGLFYWQYTNGDSVLQQPFDDFNEHQSISDSKRSKSKFADISKNPQEMPRIPKNPQENPAQFNLREDKLIKDKYMDYVQLTPDEHQKLLDLLGKDKLQEYIERLNDYIGQIGLKKANAKYTSHYHTIRNWFRNDGNKDTGNNLKSTAKHCFDSFKSTGYTCGPNYQASDPKCQVCKSERGNWV